ncbi:ABC transporter permease [Clostridium brassicae]|uniref:ABC transporter permease n=1 Tax=Clostridium brassicae TaxID=2999072 RepID=A0ABT4DDS0_9CLOT|nr:ABC transporter permease [Clostridium brassicae]MCY6960463.1 ABC transporter permease [Clostridium brassicae]
MFRQIKYALLDIKVYKRISIIFFIQMVVVLLLVNSCITQIITVNNGLNRLQKLKDNKAYVNRDATSNGKIDSLIADERNSVPKLKELYSYIINNNITNTYSKFEYQTSEQIEGNTIVQATANKMFFDIYDIKAVEGRMFNESDFIGNSKIIPVVVGYNLKDRYKLGEIYLERDLDTNKDINYKVIGIIEYNSSYPSLGDIGKETELNYTFFKPLNINLINNFSSMDMAISSTVVFTNNEKEVRAIEEKSVELGLFSMKYRPIQEDINKYLDYFHKKITYQIFIAFIVLFFAATSMALNLTTMISKNIREFSIHMICGAEISSIIERFLWQLLIIMSLALVPTVIVYDINISLLYTIVIACIISLLIMSIPYIKLKRTNIIELIRRND